ncbi:hypothetical protein ROE7235_01495 [Roseibaca ekhonensis]|jgi:hypothetical protein|uniref:Uncharacterized protein n=1 Tax=Roseinatronobacter ekhonensis TaxID=254356 RepID=A0A3B0M6X1_9RHOB|nr:hypothetical protein [Roseibaca ekhonensis]SUZ31745.1 hypothetical protein ROE7235_01495 [Roseibaca ekhonensis]
MMRRYLIAACAIIATGAAITALMKQADMRVVLIVSAFAGGLWGKLLAKGTLQEYTARNHAWAASFPLVFLVATAFWYFDGTQGAALNMAYLYIAITLVLALTGGLGTAFRLSGDERYRHSQRHAAHIAQRVLVLGVCALALVHLGQIAALELGLGLFVALALHEASYHAAMWWQERGADE